MTEHELRNKIHELRGNIASDWLGVEERKHMYQRLAVLEGLLKEINETKDKPQEEKET